MGAYSTVSITRTDALNKILRQIDDATDDQLENVLFALFGDQTLNNFMIVDDEDYPDEDDWCCGGNCGCDRT